MIVDIDKETSIKAKATIHELQSVEVEVLNADLASADSFDTILSYIEERNLDVSVLINNAGLYHVSSFKNMTTGQIQSIISINLVAVTTLTKRLLPRLKSRNNRSAIINMSSHAGSAGLPYSSIYSATKAYVTIFSRTLNEEVKDKIDVLCVTPLYVSTNMTKMPVGGIVVSPEDCVKGALLSLGREVTTFGSKKHAWICWK